MVGSLWGTDGWFRRGAASTGLTDYGIGGSTDGEEWDGVIFRWNDPRGKRATIYMKEGRYLKRKSPGAEAMTVSANRSGWANGGSDGLEGDGPLFVRTLGVSAINRDLVSIERSDGGDTSTPISVKQFESICALYGSIRRAFRGINSHSIRRMGSSRICSTSNSPANIAARAGDRPDR